MRNHFFALLLFAVLLACVYLIEGSRMQCNDIADQEVCSAQCRDKGFGSGKCDFSQCACYGQSAAAVPRRTTGRRQPSTASPSVTPLPTPKRRPLICTTNWATTRATQSYDSCMEFCDQKNAILYASFDTLCCCQKP